MNSLFTPVIAGMFGAWEIVLLIAVIVLLFGGKKLPELAKGLGKSIKEFKKASSEDNHEETPEAKPAAPKAVEAAKTDTTHGAN